VCRPSHDVTAAPRPQATPVPNSVERVGELDRVGSADESDQRLIRAMMRVAMRGFYEGTAKLAAEL
jgi:hypothetical protein